MVQHVSLECRPGDADAHDRFWRALGFAPVEVPEGLAGRAAWFAKGPTQVHLLWREDPVVPPSGHVAVQVDDPAATGLVLEARRPHWGEPRFYTRGPGGHLVELFTTPPPSPAR